MTAATTPSDTSPSTPILVDGDEIDERLARRIREVRILNYLRLPDVCTFSATFPKGADGVPEPIDEHPFAIGSALEIKLGAREELTAATLFKGDVVSLDVDLADRRACRARPRPLARAPALEGCRRSRTTPRATSSRRFCGRPASSRRPTRAATRTRSSSRTTTPIGTSSGVFAERIGFELVVEDGTAHFRRQTHEETPLQLEWPIAPQVVQPLASPRSSRSSRSRSPRRTPRPSRQSTCAPKARSRQRGSG